jgi:hypothetical protein
MRRVQRAFRRVLVAVVVASLAPVASPAGAVPQAKKEKPVAPKPELPTDVETAEQLLTKLDYDKANDIADRVIKQKNLTHDQLVRAYKILAITNAILDKEEGARDAFLQLLVFDPDYTLDTNLGPKVSTPFVEARGQYRSLPSKPGMEVFASVRSDGGQLRVITRDPTRIAKKVNVGYRWTSSGEFTVSQISVGEGTVEVSAAPQGRTRLDFYAQALDERENAVFEAGSPAVPKSTFVEAGPKPPPPGKATEQKSGSVFSSPIFWIFAGAAVAGGGTALFFALRPQDPPTQASLAPVIRCGSEICK